MPRARKDRSLFSSAPRARTATVGIAVAMWTGWADGARGASERGAPAQIVLKVASVEMPGSPSGVHLEALRRHVEAATGGQVRVKLLLAGTLGDEPTLVERTRAGSVQAFAGRVTALVPDAPALDVLMAPYLFAGEKEADRSLDGPVRRAIGPSLERAGLRFAGWGPADFRVWYSRGRHLRRPVDAAGLRVGPGRSTAETQTYRSLGMTEVALGPLDDIADLQRRGRVDVFDDTLLGAVAASRSDAATHLTLSQHALAPTLVAYSKRWFDGLPEKLQRDLLRVPVALARDARRRLRDMTPDLLDHLRRRGTDVHEASRSERTAFARVTRNVARTVADRAGAQARRILAAARR